MTDLSDFAKFSSIIQPDDENDKNTEEKQIDNAVTNLSKSKGSLASRLFNKTASGAGNLASTAGKGLANIGTRVLAGGMAAVQTASIASLALSGGALFGVFGALAGGNDDYAIEYYDDKSDADPYDCIDEYSEAYKGVFGTLNTSPLAEQNNIIVTRLRELNEWSKTYVGQNVPDKLLCNNPDCPYYQHEGCTDPDHEVIQTQNTNESYYNSGAQIDLAYVKRIHSFFSEYGLTDVQIAAICGVATIESRIDFTSLEGYSIQGDRYNLDPSAVVGEYGFKPWAEGITSSITTPTCIHQIVASNYTGTDAPIDYAAYSAKYPAIQKLGIGIIGFTDGPGFYNNSFLRNYADYINDRVTLMQNIIEGGRGWQNMLRERAADLYTIAYGASGDNNRGTAQSYYEFVNPDNLLLLSASDDKSSGWRYKSSWDAYLVAEKELVDAVDEYEALVAQYQSAADELTNTPWEFFNVTATPMAGGLPIYDVTFEDHEADKLEKWATDDTSGNLLDIFDEVNQKTEYIAGSSDYDDVSGYVEYTSNPSGDGNNTDVIYRKVNDKWELVQIGTLNTFSSSYNGGLSSEPTAPVFPNITPPNPPSPPTLPAPGAPPIPPEMPLNPSMADIMMYISAMQAYAQEMAAYEQQRDEYDNAWSQYYSEWNEYVANINAYNAAVDNYNASVDAYNIAKAEYDADVARYETEKNRIANLTSQANDAASKVKEAYDKMMEKRELYEKARDLFNTCSKNHAEDVVRFYNALADYYTAIDFDLEAMVRDATYTSDTIFEKTKFYSKEFYEYTFDAIIDGKPVKFSSLFGNMGEDDVPTPQELKCYYELWQNYAKYNTNLPQNGKYINWWLPEVQLLFLVGGSYDAEKGQGLKIRDEYVNQTCSQCSQVPQYDTIGKYYHDWMSTWKGDDYTGRDITTATRNFYYDIVSGGFDDGTLERRTEYAMAYYYMFQYDSPYQQMIQYASVGGEASDIMEEMIAEGRWQTNTSNTLSDTAMPHNDKWKEFQTNDINRFWDIDTSTSMSTSILSTLGVNQSRSKVNLLNDIWTGCRYINVINNSTIGNSAMYLVDNPLIYGDENDKFYILKYGVNPDPKPEPVSKLYKVVYNLINRRLIANGKEPIGEDKADADVLSDGFTFVKTCVLWSGLDKEFENIMDVDDLKEYLEEATSSVWQDSEDYQTDPDSEKSIGRGNSKIWEQRRMGPYYDDNGTLYWKYKWVLVPRVLDDSDASTNQDWYNDIRDGDSSFGLGNVEDDEDDVDIHGVDEHNGNNKPSVSNGDDTDGYARKLNENGMTADWVRVDWECWDEDCPICGGKGGHGDTNMLCPGDIMIKDDKVCMWLGETAVQSMFPLESQNDPKLVYAGGDEATRIKSMDEANGFEWSAPYDGYTNHADAANTDDYATTPTTSDSASNSSTPYDPDGKWTVYRLITSNYTDAYRDAGIVYNPSSMDDWEIWLEYKWKGMEQESSSTRYINEIREKLGLDIITNYPRDEFKISD